MPREERIIAFLDMAREDLDAAEVLARTGNHYAAYHVHQATEKVVKALLLHAGVEAGREHRLDALVERLPASSAWIQKLEPWLPWSTYATAYRYPTVAGRKPRRPPASEVLEAVDALRVLEAEARADVS
ncbi:MAG: HEPN domain-containing protein [Alphaproteobacteria bacterium]|nr:HEPN domain-containing protein [Alphaproteobacteria bacterium]